MEHQNQYIKQKVVPLTGTSTVQSLIENTQGDSAAVVHTPQNKLADDPPYMHELRNEDGNTQSASFRDGNHIQHTHQQSSSHNQNGNSSPLNTPHNFLPNSHLPNEVNNDGFIYDSGCRQTINIMPEASPGASPTTPVSTNRSFNTRNTAIDNSGHVNNYYNIQGNVKFCPFRGMGWTTSEEDHHHDRGPGMTIINQEEPSSPLSYGSGTVPMASTTKVDLAVPRSFNTQISPSNLGTLSRSMQALSTSLSTSTTYHVHEGGLASTSSLHPKQEHHNLEHASIVNTRTPEVDVFAATTGRLGEQGTVLQFASHLPPEGNTILGYSFGISNLHPSLREPLPVVKDVGNVDTTAHPRRVRKIFTDSVNQLRHSAKSIKSSFKSGTQSMASSKPFSSVGARSKARIPLEFVKRVPVVPLRGEKKKFPENVDVHIHATLDPSPGLEPFRPLRDPSMTHRYSVDGSLPPVYGVNVYDVGYFNGAGQFILLFNLQMTKEENEKLLNFQFKTTSFLPLTGGAVHSSPFTNKNFHVWNDKNILLARTASAYNKSNSLQYMFRFKVRSQITRGTAIVVMGQVRQYVDLAEVVTTQEDYFEAQSIEWYRHAKKERNRNIQNGDLVLITQCYKAPSWGYINYQSKEGTTQDTWAAFQPMTGKGLYGWVYESPLIGLESSQYQSTEEDPTAGPLNQCIGIRAYSIRCDPQAWKSMCRELESP